MLTGPTGTGPWPPRSVCIMMMGAVGDAVHVLPVVTALKRHHPAVRITWVLQPGPASLVRGHTAVDEIIVFERKRGWRAFVDIRRVLAGRTFDLVLDLQVYLKTSIVLAFARSPIKLGYDRARAHDLNWLFTNRRIPPHPLQHVQDQYLEFLSFMGMSAEPLEWGIGPWPSERSWQRDFVAKVDRPIASLVIGTSKPEKDWLPERWAEVVNGLHSDYGLEPVLVGGRSPGELETERRIVDLAAHAPLSTLGIPLRDLVGVLDASSLVISLDTGPLHIAVALERPVVSLIGHLDPRRAGPYRRFHDLVIDAFHDPGEVSPITDRRRKGRMRRITVPDVMEKVALWKERYSNRPKS